MPLPNFFEFYIEELKRQENSSQEGYNPNTETWEPIIAPEWTGSRDNSWAPRKWDIGYGCKITSQDEFIRYTNNPPSKNDINQLLIGKIESKYDQVRNDYNNRFGDRQQFSLHDSSSSSKWPNSSHKDDIEISNANQFDKLPNNLKIVLTDYNFNGVYFNKKGSKDLEFPAFTNAVQDFNIANQKNDKEGMQGALNGMWKEYVRKTGEQQLGERNNWTREQLKNLGQQHGIPEPDISNYLKNKTDLSELLKSLNIPDFLIQTMTIQQLIEFLNKQISGGGAGSSPPSTTPATPTNRLR
jgi:hypothetical protein